MPIFKCGFRILPILFLLFCGSSPTFTQVLQTTLPPDQMKDDFRILRQTFEKAHGGLYRYTPKKQMDGLKAGSTSR